MSQSVKLKGNEVTVDGVFLQPGHQAKAFTLVTKDLSEATLESYKGKRKVLNIFQVLILAFVLHLYANLTNSPMTSTILLSCVFLLTCLLHKHVFVAQKV